MSTLFATPQADLAFPQSLTEKYRPRAIQDFCGLEKPKKVLAKLVANPRSLAMIFAGPPGSGKTTMAYAYAAAIGAEVHHIGSAECKIDTLQEMVRMCQYVPLSGGFHVCVVDEADVMSDAAQKYLLSRLDSTEAAPKTIWIFTCNDTDEQLEPRFVSRCLRLDFNSYGAGSEIVDLLARIWKAEAGDAEPPNFKRMANGNVRLALQNLDLALLES